MITEHELKEAIAECQGQRNPNANTCIKLASFYTILDHLSSEEKRSEPRSENSYSFAAYEPQGYSSDTEFGMILKQADSYDVLHTIDELMETLRVMHPKLYDAFIRKLTALD